MKPHQSDIQTFGLAVYCFALAFVVAILLGVLIWI